MVTYGTEIDVMNEKKYYVIYSNYGSWRYSFGERGKKAMLKKIVALKSKYGMMA